VEFVLKNIILYDPFGNVSGFAEFKIRQDRTNIRVRYNDGGGEVLTLSIVANGQPARSFELAGVQSLFELRGYTDAEKEIFVCINKRESGEVKTLASGVINQAKIDKRQEICEVAEAVEAKPVAVKELDEALRKICVVDENGKGQCETCPYREHFFGTAVDADDDVVV